MYLNLNSLHCAISVPGMPWDLRCLNLHLASSVNIQCMTSLTPIKVSRKKLFYVKTEV